MRRTSRWVRLLTAAEGREEEDEEEDEEVEERKDRETFRSFSSSPMRQMRRKELPRFLLQAPFQRETLSRKVGG